MGKPFVLLRSAGDIIYSLPAIRAHSGGGDIYCSLEPRLFASLKPLIDSQPGFHLYPISEGLPPGAIDLDGFRYRNVKGEHIATAFAEVLGVKINLNEPWLDVDAEPNDFAFINITPRYRDKVFMWGKEVDHLWWKYGYDKLRFIGHKDEFKRYGSLLKYLPTHNHLIAAQYIAGGQSFSGTQSSLLAIAEGLVVPYRYERSPFSDNVRTGRKNEKIINPVSRNIHKLLANTQRLLSF